MPPTKRPDKRSAGSKSLGQGDDPRYIALARDIALRRHYRTCRPCLATRSSVLVQEPCFVGAERFLRS